MVQFTGQVGVSAGQLQAVSSIPALSLRKYWGAALPTQTGGSQGVNRPTRHIIDTQLHLDGSFSRSPGGSRARLQARGTDRLKQVRQVTRRGCLPVGATHIASSSQSFEHELNHMGTRNIANLRLGQSPRFKLKFEIILCLRASAAACTNSTCLY